MRYFYILCCLVVIAWYGSQIYRQAQIRLWVPGATVSTYTVTKKWRQIAVGGVERFDYMVAWDDLLHANSAMNVTQDYWNTLSVGGQVTVVCVGDGKPHGPGNAGIWASDGNIGFNMLIMLVALGIIIFHGVKIATGDADGFDFRRNV